MSPGRERLDALTGLRFVAAASVMLFHFWHDLPGRMGTLPFTVAGYTGVSLFFILSGFVLGYNYLDRAATIRLGAFYWARFARVYPVYLLGALVTLCIAWNQRSPQIAVTEFAFYLPLVQAWIGQRALMANGAGWSLSVEAFFYLLFPFIALRIVKLDARAAMWTLLVSAMIGVVPQAIGMFAVHHFNVGMNTNDDLGSLLKFYPIFHLPEFVCGVALARVQGLRRPGGPAWRSDALVVASFAAIWVLAISPFHLPWTLRFTCGLTLPFCLLISALASKSGLFVRLLSLGPIVLLGEASYSLYLFHMPAYWIMFDRLTSNRFIVAAVAIVVSLAVHLLVERPAREYLLRRARPPEPAAEFKVLPTA